MKLPLLRTALILAALLAGTSGCQSSPKSPYLPPGQVPVTFKSDGKTWVSIEGRLNLTVFRETITPLLPGDYKIIGRRSGYPDVVKTLHVPEGKSPPPMTIIAVP